MSWKYVKIIKYKKINLFLFFFKKFCAGIFGYVDCIMIKSINIAIIPRKQPNMFI